MQNLRGSAAVVILLASLVGACSSEEPEVSTATGNIEEESDGTSKDKGTTTESTEEPEETTTTTEKLGVQIVVVETGLTVGPGYDGRPAGDAGAVLRNDGDEQGAFIEVVFNFKDAAGTAVGTQTSYLYAVDPGGVAHAAVSQVSLQGEAVSVEASAIVDDQGFGPDGLVIPVEVTFVGPEEFTGLAIRGTATNPTDEVVEGGTVTCVLRSGGRIVGGATASIATMTPGAQVAWETFSFTEGLTADAAECSGGSYS